jgi:hypothetical protein
VELSTSEFLAGNDFRLARDSGEIWRIHYEPQADFSILIDCAGGPRALAEAHSPVGVDHPSISQVSLRLH